MNSDSSGLLTDLLRQVSRSFYTTLRILPGKVRPQIGLAYLLARTTDTIADTAIVPLDQRLFALQSLRERIRGSHKTALDLGGLTRQQASRAESALLQRVEEAITLLEQLSPPDQKLVREVLEIIISGQELDLKRFADASKHNIIALGTDADLDDYTYRVAGCVGRFWTKICRAHLFPRACLDDARLEADGIRFGKGLQLVNILRDIPADLADGRCYMPLERLAGAGLRPEDLLQPENGDRFRKVHQAYLMVARAHLAAGWAYTQSLPRSSVRIRLACAWPILFGARTLTRLEERNVLDPSHPIKIGRAEVRSLMLRSILYYPLATRWQRLFQEETPAATASRS